MTFVPTVLPAAKSTAVPATARIVERIGGGCLLVAPPLLAISSVLWFNDATRLAAGIAQVYAFIFALPAVLTIARWVQPQAPRLALVVGLWGSFGCVGGINYGSWVVFQWSLGYVGADAATRQAVGVLADTQLWPILNLPGLSFPIVLLILSVGLLRTGMVPRWLPIVLGCGAVLFPLGRIPHIEICQHLADLCILASFGWLGWHLLAMPTPRHAAAPVVA